MVLNCNNNQKKKWLKWLERKIPELDEILVSCGWKEIWRRKNSFTESFKDIFLGWVFSSLTGRDRWWPMAGNHHNYGTGFMTDDCWKFGIPNNRSSCSTTAVTVTSLGSSFIYWVKQPRNQVLYPLTSHAVATMLFSIITGRYTMHVFRLCSSFVRLSELQLFISWAFWFCLNNLLAIISFSSPPGCVDGVLDLVIILI